MCLLTEIVDGSEKNRLQMFKVTTSCPLTCTQPYSALVNGFVDNALQNARSCVNQALLQVVGVADERLVVHALLHPTPDPVVDRV